MALSIVNTYTGTSNTGNDGTVTVTGVAASAGEVLVALATCNSDLDTAVLGISSWTCSGGGLTWTQLAIAPTGTAEGGAVAYHAYVPSNISGQTITLVPNNTDFAGNLASGSAAVVHRISGAESTPGGATQTQSTLSGLPSMTVTTTRESSYVFAAAADWAQKGVGSPGAAQTEDLEQDLPGDYSAHLWHITARVAVGSNTANYASPAAQQVAGVAVEIREAAAEAAPAPARKLTFGPGPRLLKRGGPPLLQTQVFDWGGAAEPIETFAADLSNLSSANGVGRFSWTDGDDKDFDHPYNVTSTIEVNAAMLAPAASVTAGTPTQFSSLTDGTSYTTGSLTPTNAQFYLAYVFGRLDTAGTRRTPTLTGTNGWNVTWTRIAGCQTDITLGGNVVSQVDVFYGTASSGTAGTLTFNFTAGPNYGEGALYLVPITGTVAASPIGATGSANSGGSTVTSVSATLTGSPATTSTVVALGTTDTESGTFTAGTNYALLGTREHPDVAATQLEKWDDPTNTTVGITNSATDVMGIAAVEVQEVTAAITQVQKKSAEADTQVTSLAATFDASPTSGNLIVVCVSSDATVNTPSGFSLAIASVADTGTYIFYKTAGASESSTVTVSPTALAETDLAIFEYSGDGVWSVDKTASNVSGTTLTTCATGTTAATTVADELCVAVVGINLTATGSLRSPVSWTNSFTSEYAIASIGGGTDNELAVGTKVVSATGTQTSTASWSTNLNQVDDAQGAIATFKSEAVADVTALAAQPLLEPHGQLWSWTDSDDKDFDYRYGYAITLEVHPALFQQTPWFAGNGATTIASSGSDNTASMPSGILADDILLWTIEHQDAAATPPLLVANGFEPLPVSPQVAESGLSGTRTTLSVFWKRAVGGGSDAAPVFNGTGPVNPVDHSIAVMHVFRNVATSGLPWDFIAGDSDTTGSTTITIPGGVTRIDSTLVIGTSCSAADIAVPDFSGWTDASLSNTREITDVFTNQNNGGGLGVAIGEMFVAGTFSTLTATVGTSTKQGRIVLALRPTGAPEPTETFAAQPLLEPHAQLWSWKDNDDNDFDYRYGYATTLDVIFAEAAQSIADTDALDVTVTETEDLQVSEAVEVLAAQPHYGEWGWDAALTDTDVQTSTLDITHVFAGQLIVSADTLDVAVIETESTSAFEGIEGLIAAQVAYTEDLGRTWGAAEADAETRNETALDVAFVFADRNLTDTDTVDVAVIDTEALAQFESIEGLVAAQLGYTEDVQTWLGAQADVETRNESTLDVAYVFADRTVTDAESVDVAITETEVLSQFESIEGLIAAQPGYTEDFGRLEAEVAASARTELQHETTADIAFLFSTVNVFDADTLDVAIGDTESLSQQEGAEQVIAAQSTYQTDYGQLEGRRAPEPTVELANDTALDIEWAQATFSLSDADGLDVALVDTETLDAFSGVAELIAAQQSVTEPGRVEAERAPAPITELANETTLDTASTVVADRSITDTDTVDVQVSESEVLDTQGIVEAATAQAGLETPGTVEALFGPRLSIEDFHNPSTYDVSWAFSTQVFISDTDSLDVAITETESVDQVQRIEELSAAEPTYGHMGGMEEALRPPAQSVEGWDQVPLDISWLFTTEPKTDAETLNVSLSEAEVLQTFSSIVELVAADPNYSASIGEVEALFPATKTIEDRDPTSLDITWFITQLPPPLFSTISQTGSASGPVGQTGSADDVVSAGGAVAVLEAGSADSDIAQEGGDRRSITEEGGP